MLPSRALLLMPLLRAVGSALRAPFSLALQSPVELFYTKPRPSQGPVRGCVELRAVLLHLVFSTAVHSQPGITCKQSCQAWRQLHVVAHDLSMNCMPAGITDEACGMVITEDTAGAGSNAGQAQVVKHDVLLSYLKVRSMP